MIKSYEISDLENISFTKYRVHAIVLQFYDYYR